MLQLGEFGTDNYSAEDASDIGGVWTFFILTTFLSQILIMNMLINMTGEALGAFLPRRDEIALSATIQLMYDNNISYLDETEQVEKFMFVVEPDDKGFDEDENLASRIKSVKKDVQASLKEQSKSFQEKLDLVQQEISNAVSKSVTLEEKVDNLNIQQKQQTELVLKRLEKVTDEVRLNRNPMTKQMASGMTSMFQKKFAQANQDAAKSALLQKLSSKPSE